MSIITSRLLTSLLPLTILVGCASKEHGTKGPVPGSGIAEYRQVADDALKTLDQAMGALDQVSAQTNTLSPKVLTAFSEAVDRLDVDSITIRARGQAMQARGEAYFQQWHENLAKMQDPAVRQLAEQHRPELEKCFANIKQRTQEAREAFKPFLSGLHKLLITLENDPAAIKTDAARAMLKTLKENGNQVQKGIVSVKEELNKAKMLITPGVTGKG